MQSKHEFYKIAAVKDDDQTAKYIFHGIFFDTYVSVMK